MIIKSILKRNVNILFLITLVITTFATQQAYAYPEARTRYVAPQGNDSGDCSSSSSPCLSIQYAVNKSTSGDTILVAEGNYNYKQSVDTCSFLPTGGKSVICIVDKVLTILGGYSINNWQVSDPGNNFTSIDGQNNYRGVFVLGYQTTNTSLRMEGFTIQNCKSIGPDTPGDPSGFGGGMMVAGAYVTLRDIRFLNNSVYGQSTSNAEGGAGTGSGLAIQWSQSGTTSLLERVTFEGNRSYGGNGPERGGVSFGALFANASITARYIDFTNNIAQAGSSSGSGKSNGLCADGLGGAMGGGGGTWVLEHITAIGNQAVGGNGSTYPGGGFGGAIHVENAYSFVLRDSYIAQNKAQGGNAVNGGFGAGGGVLVNNTPAIIERVQVYSNNAIGGSSTSGNKAGAGGGGGLYLWRTSTEKNPNASIINSIIAENYVALGSSGNSSSGGGGGGIQIQGQPASIDYSTIAGNALGPNLVSGQAILVLASPGVSSGSADIKHTIISNHVQGGNGASAVLVQTGNIITFDNGIFSGNNKDTNSNGSPMAVGTIFGLSTMMSVPSVGFVSTNGFNNDYHILPNSPAINSAEGSFVNEDIDGETRPFNGIADIGADEYIAPTLVATPSLVVQFADNSMQPIREVTINVSSGPSTTWTAVTSAKWLYLGTTGQSHESTGQTGEKLVLSFLPDDLPLGNYSSTVEVSTPEGLTLSIPVQFIKVEQVYEVFLPLIARQ